MATLVSSSSRVNTDSMSPPMSPLLFAQRPGLPASAAFLGPAGGRGRPRSGLLRVWSGSGIGSMAAHVKTPDTHTQ